MNLHYQLRVQMVPLSVHPQASSCTLQVLLKNLMLNMRSQMVRTRPLVREIYSPPRLCLRESADLGVGRV